MGIIKRPKLERGLMVPNTNVLGRPLKVDLYGIHGVYITWKRRGFERREGV